MKMRVLKAYNDEVSMKKYTKVTIHFRRDRKERHEFIIGNIGYGETKKVFLVDRGHENGLELHEVTTTGIVRIYNAQSKKWVTMLIAQPYQITRYYDALGLKAPAEVLKLASMHYAMGWNEL